MQNQVLNLPDRETIENIIGELSQADLSKVSYHKVFYTLFKQLSIPVTTAKLKKGHHIERARVNEPGQIFNAESEITYRTDFKNITKFGRANCPGQSLFYGAVKAENIEYPRIINLFETSELFREKDNLNENAEFTMTVGKWRVKEDIEIAEVVFNQSNIENIPQIKESYEYQFAKIKNDFPDRVDDIARILQFFSDEFAKKDIKSHEDYKISAAYTDMIINTRTASGITYPSTRTDSQGFNVALTIHAVENSLELEVVGMFKVIKKGKHTLIDNLGYATDLGAMKGAFNWIGMEGTNEEIINKILLQD